MPYDNTSQDLIKERVLTYARMRDERIRTIAGAVRWFKKTKKRREELRQLVRRAMQHHAEKSTGEMADFRPGVGSGRLACWFAPEFEYLSMAAQTIFRDSRGSLRGDDLRQLARRLAALWASNAGASAWDHIETPFPSCIEVEPSDFYGWIKSENGMKWFGYHRNRLMRRWGEIRLDQILQEDGVINGYLADSITSWRDGKHGYEGCCGCEFIAAAKSRPDVWDQLLARAPVGKVVRNDDGEITCEQTYPHERERMQDLRDRGWAETLRMADSLWHPTVEKALGLSHRRGA